MKQFFRISKEAASDFFNDDTMTLAAALALYTVIALAPLVTVMITIAGWIFGEAASQSFVSQVEGLIGTSGRRRSAGLLITPPSRAPARCKASSGLSFCSSARRPSSRSCSRR
jgi:hypothetical protein